MSSRNSSASEIVESLAETAAEPLEREPESIQARLC